MIGFVVVSHSAKLAEGVCDLARQVAQGKVRIAAAGGTSDAANPIGTDAFKVLEAIETVYSEDGVLVFMDLGSAVLSAETAMELLAEEKRRNVRLCSAPLVEGIVAAVSQAAAGAGLAEIIQEAESALAAKAGSSQVVPDSSQTRWEENLVTLSNALGLHARPAAILVRIARTCDAPVTIENLTGGTGPCDATSINGILSLGARKGHQLRLRTCGPMARQVLASIESFLASGCGDELQASPIKPVSGERAPGDQLNGLPASAGIAIGPLLKLRSGDVVVKVRAAEEPAVEWRRLQDAIRGAQQETRDLYEWAMAHAGSNEAGIFDAQSLFLEDPVLKNTLSHSVLEEGLNAEQAWQEASGSLVEQLASLSDPYLRARAADVADVAMRVLRRLVNLESRLPDVREPSILAGHDVKPSEVKDLNKALVLGLCLEGGAASAHSSILARAMGIPAVVGLGPALSLVDDGTTVALDGERGIVWVSPDPARRAELENSRQSWLVARQAAQSRRLEPSCTRDGHRVRVFANINSVRGAAEALDCGADGVGVVRTEFLFLDRLTAPSEEEQFGAYRAIAGALGDRPLVIRTLDAGGDKSLSYLDIGEEANPFLGWRGIRLTLDRPDLLKAQFRAILRAAVGHRVEILLPMVSSLSELRQARVLLHEAEVELERGSVAFQRDVKLAVMIEVPSAVAIADQLAREASHLSIGTNDLVQYAMAADRTNPRVFRIADPFQPAVLRMLQQVIHAGSEAGTGVTLCGEFAADALATPVLLGLGLREFSVSAPLIPELKHAIAQWSLPEAVSLAAESLGLESADAVRKAVHGRRSR